MKSVRFLSLSIAIVLILNILLQLNFPISASSDMVKGKIIEALENAVDTLDVSSFHIDADDIGSIFFEVLDENPRFFYADAYLQYTYYIDSHETAVLTFSYYYPKNEINNRKQLFRQSALQLLNGIDPSWSNLEKILYVHDYIITNADYDTKAQSSSTSPESYTAYGVLVTGKGVCESYTRAFNYIMKQLGIESMRVMSTGMGHTWNMVNLDGQWFHMDLTWDDPLLDNKPITGHVGHEHFLLNDTEIGTNHYGWASEVKASSEKYSDIIWRNVTNYFYSINDKWYSSEDNYIKKYNINSNTSEIIYKSYASIATSSVGSDSRIYFNFNNRIYSILPDGDDFKNEFWNSNGTSIYKISVQNKNQIWYSTKDNITSKNYALTFINNWSDWNVKTPATCTAEGLMTRTNSQTNEVQTKVIPPDGHTVVTWSILSMPTYIKTGSRYGMCTVCKKTVTEETPMLSLPFKDVTDDKWYNIYVRNVFVKGLMAGISDDTFGGDVILTRAMFVTSLSRLDPSFNAKDYNISSFKDVDMDSWYAPFIAWAYEQGFVSGITKDTFGPNEYITREQMAVIMYNYAYYLGFDTTIQDPLDDYTDTNNISNWAMTAIKWAVGANIISGTTESTLSPKDNATRAQAATIIYNFDNLNT